VVQDLSFNTHRFRIVFLYHVFSLKTMLQSGLYVEMRDFCIWFGRTAFGLVWLNYVPFDATLLEEERGQRDE
jgi:hypothetical protein